MEVILTGELVTIAGIPGLVVDVAAGMTVDALVAELAARASPGFAEVRATGEFPGLGRLTLLLDGSPLDLPDDGTVPVRGGVLYVIPPIMGG